LLERFVAEIARNNFHPVPVMKGIKHQRSLNEDDAQRRRTSCNVIAPLGKMKPKRKEALSHHEERAPFSFICH